MTLPEALTFDDVLLIPQHSDVLPQQAQIAVALTASLHLQLPLLSAAMDTVTESAMATAMALAGGLGVVHKNLSIHDQVKEVSKVKNSHAQPGLQVAAAIGVGEQGNERAAALVAAGIDMLVIDSAHGHTKTVLTMVAKIKTKYPQVALMAGNVATAVATQALANAGADVIKIGIGPGSICTTRVVAGVGMPQLTAILQCAVAARACGVTLVADGGIRHSGDVVKALAAGAHAVMIGSLLAGTDEAPGEQLVNQGRAFKSYRGMGSVAAMRQGSAERYFQSNEGQTSKLVAEGVEGMVPATGSLSSCLNQLCGGLRAGMGYVGANNLEQLRERGQFVRISSASLHEGHVHDVIMTQAAPNYSL